MDYQALARFPVEACIVRAGFGLAWPTDRLPSATSTRKKGHVKDTVFDLRIGDREYVGSFRYPTSSLQLTGASEGVIGNIQNESGELDIRVVISGFTPISEEVKMRLIDFRNESIVEVSGWLYGTYNTSMLCGVYAVATSASGAQFCITGPNFSEFLTSTLRLFQRTVYGFTSSVDVFERDPLLIAAVLLYTELFTPGLWGSGDAS